MKRLDSSYWFKCRRYGYGWTPVRWQGWLILVGFIVTSIGFVYWIDGSSSIDNSLTSATAIVCIILFECGVLIAVCRAKGPAPRWRWGAKPSDDPREDF